MTLAWPAHHIDCSGLLFVRFPTAFFFVVWCFPFPVFFLGGGFALVFRFCFRLWLAGVVWLPVGFRARSELGQRHFLGAWHCQRGGLHQHPLRFLAALSVLLNAYVLVGVDGWCPKQVADDYLDLVEEKLWHPRSPV